MPAQHAMTLYFAYGSNMSRALMARRCPSAIPLGPATLDRHRFIIMTAGYASVAPRSGDTVHGVLWRLRPRDLAALNAYEALDAGLYRRATLPVRAAEGIRPALIYLGRTDSPGRPKPAYLETVLDAARDWNLPADYVAAIGRFAAGGWRGVRPTETGELG